MILSLTKQPITATPPRAYTLHTSIFCSLIAVYTAATYWLLRLGLADNPVFPVLQVLGLSLFLILLTDNLHRFSSYLNNGLESYWYWHYSLLVTGVLLIFFVFGSIAPNLGYPLTIILAFMGYLFFFLSLVDFLRGIKLLPLIIFLISCLLFAIWISSLCWAFMLKPIFFESIVASSSKLWLTDTLYNISMAQMIKTYQVPSTGMDGLPYMKYHFGSHWLLAMLSNLLKMHVIDAYNLAYPVIFPPLVFQAFFQFILEVRAYLFKETKNHAPDSLFWFILLGVFIGFTKSLIAGNQMKAFTGGDLLFFSESYVISIFFLFATFALVLSFWRNQSQYQQLDKLLFYLLLLPALLSVTGFMKVSTMYIMAGLLGYLFLRLKLYRSPVYICSLLVLFLSFIGTYYSVVDFTYTEGGFDWLYFFRAQQTPLLKFFAYMYLWSYLFIGIFFISKKLYYWQSLKKSFADYQTLAVECILVTVFLGLLPVVLIVLFVGNALYFTELNIFVAGALFLAYLPSFHVLLVHVRRKLGKLLYGILAGAVAIWSVVVWQYNARGYMDVMIGANLIDRTTLVKDTTLESDIRIAATKALIRLDMNTMYNVLEPYGHPAQVALDSSKAYRLLLELRKLDQLPLTEKQQSLIFFDPGTIDPTWQIRCYNLPFVVPVVSGIASLNGMLYNDCSWSGGYGFDSYQKKDPAERGKVYTFEELCAQAKVRGFAYLYTYEPEKKTFVKTTCGL